MSRPLQTSPPGIFCFAPWSNLEILPGGSILPCCKFQDQFYDQRYSVTQNSLQDYLDSDMLVSVKQDFKNNQWPKGCERCRIEENSNIPSKRELDYARWQQHYENFDTEHQTLLTLSLAIGNTCNLKCIMCGPAASSSWAKEYQDIYGVRTQSIRRFRRNIVPEVTDISSQLVHIDIHGGEPFLSGQQDHEKLLDHFVQTRQSKNISIHYTTNGSIWPENHWFEKWSEFQEVEIQISIDGVGPRYEYIRYPGKWHVLEANIDRYLALVGQNSKFKLSVAHTVSAYNIRYLDEFFSWCQCIGLPTPWTGKLHRPHHLRPSVWPESVRLDMIDCLNISKHSQLQHWAHHLANEDDSQYFDEFRRFTETHDRYRGSNFQETFPELAKHM